MVQNRLVHFEIPAEDVQRLVDFYTALFDWKPEPMGTSGDRWYLRAGGSPDGAVVPKQGVNLFPVNYVMVDDLEKSLARVVDHGGKILLEPTRLGDNGRYAIAQDPEGNPIGLYTEK